MTIKEVDLPTFKAIPIKTKEMPYLCSVYRWLGINRSWQTTEDWSYQLADGSTVLIRKGFIFDGASIPRIFRPLLSPTGILLIPSIIHDYAYQHNKLYLTSGLYYKPRAGKLYWDKLFYKICLDVNGLRIVSFLAYCSLLIGGGASWYSHNGNKITMKIARLWIKCSNVIHLLFLGSIFALIVSM